MSNAVINTSTDNSENYQLLAVLKKCISLDLLNHHCNCYDDTNFSHLNYCSMQQKISSNTSISGNISTSSFASDDSIGDNIVEEDGRISLAYENLRNIPRRVAERFAAHTRYLDLSYNHFQNLSFLSFFDELDTLILDRNYDLDIDTLPFLPNLKILWINNCNISNMAEWVLRIRDQCPSLEYLSVMGNPGINNVLPSSTPLANYDAGPMPTPVTNDYREYILKCLPQLQNLDGEPRNNKFPVVNQNNCLTSTSSYGNSQSTSSISNDKSPGEERIKQIIRTLSFRDMFQLKNKRKKLYLSSSTN
ncbi:uncharacterized protein LOC101460732 isoform X1 [Ceratitis capitata]|uniref:Leucine-rich repeat-containing protein C10orf11 n=1 Tax=Ceratitis capitata TaxID=7213 RepID=W8BFZ6_CERCA|nr:uncharacterized protein LOC101460732 isoform X1 [Ceratitis capitata]